MLFPTRVAPGFRALFRLLAEPLAKLYAGDNKKLQALGVDRRERLPPPGHPLRDLANKLAAQLGIEEFDMYLTAAQRTGKTAASRRCARWSRWSTDDHPQHLARAGDD